MIEILPAVVLTLLFVSIVGNVAFYIAAQRQMVRADYYEEAIQEFYSRTAITLHTMKTLDEKKMFESDDEVGSVFEQIVETVNELRPFIYGAEDAETEEE